MVKWVAGNINLPEKPLQKIVGTASAFTTKPEKRCACRFMVDEEINLPIFSPVLKTVVNMCPWHFVRH